MFTNALGFSVQEWFGYACRKDVGVEKKYVKIRWPTEKRRYISCSWEKTHQYTGLALIYIQLSMPSKSVIVVSPIGVKTYTIQVHAQVSPFHLEFSCILSGLNSTVGRASAPGSCRPRINPRLSLTKDLKIEGCNSLSIEENCILVGTYQYYGTRWIYSFQEWTDFLDI